MSSQHDIRICVPVHEPTLTALVAAAREATAFADVIELRIDDLEPREFENVESKLNGLITSLRRPVILTFRPAQQGGYRRISQEERQAFWHAHFDSKASFLDIESDLATDLTTRNADTQPDWSRVICSHHDFDGVPANLQDLYEQLAFSPARIIKLAFKANDIVDCLHVFRLLERAGSEQREIIAIAMGEAGVITRILGPARGSFLTYASTDAEKGTAPGQLIASDLKTVYRIDQINSDTMITGLVGLPVFHSVSPHMHNAAFQAADLNGVYLPFQVKDLGEFFKRMVDPRSREMDWNLRGLSITAPHKADVMKFLDEVEPRAQAIGAVNTVVLDNEQLLGYNTDAPGLIEPLIQRLGSVAGARAAVIGAGGAASAAVFALQQQGVDVTIYARNFAKAKLISERFNISSESLTSASFAGKDIVINATPLGSFGVDVDETPALEEQLRGSRLVYDLVYNPIETRLLRIARKAGCEVLGGLDMLVAQAKLQFKLWTKTNVSSELMYAAGSSALSKMFSRS